MTDRLERREEGSALLFSQFWHCRCHDRFYRVIAAVAVCLSGTFSIADRCFDVCPVIAEFKMLWYWRFHASIAPHMTFSGFHFQAELFDA